LRISCLKVLMVAGSAAVVPGLARRDSNDVQRDANRRLPLARDRVLPRERARERGAAT
jgi:hypothetical protein